MDTQTHGLLDAHISGIQQGELTLAANLQAPDHTLTVFDRAYFSAAFLLDWQSKGPPRHWLIRAKDNLRHEVTQTLAKGDWLVSMPISLRARQLHPHLPTHWQARLVSWRLMANAGAISLLYSMGFREHSWPSFMCSAGKSNWALERVYDLRRSRATKAK